MTVALGNYTSSTKISPILFVGICKEQGTNYDGWNVAYDWTKAGGWGFCPDSRWFGLRGYGPGEAFTDAGANPSPPIFGLLGNIGSWTHDATGGASIIAPSPVTVTFADITYDHGLGSSGSGTPPALGGAFTQTYGYRMHDLWATAQYGSWRGDLLTIWCHDGSSANADPELLYVGRITEEVTDGQTMTLTAETAADWGPFEPYNKLADYSDDPIGMDTTVTEADADVYPPEMIGRLRAPVVFGDTWVCGVLDARQRSCALTAALAATTVAGTDTMVVDFPTRIGTASATHTILIGSEVATYTVNDGTGTITITRLANQPAHEIGEPVSMRIDGPGYKVGLGLSVKNEGTGTPTGSGYNVEEVYADDKALAYSGSNGWTGRTNTPDWQYRAANRVVVNGAPGVPPVGSSPDRAGDGRLLIGQHGGGLRSFGFRGGR